MIHFTVLRGVGEHKEVDIFIIVWGRDQIMKSHHIFMKPHSLSLIDMLIHINDDTRPSECCSVNRHHQYLKWLHIRDTLNR